MEEIRAEKKRNKRASGNAFQIRCAKILISWGWTVRNFPLTVRPLFIKGKQIYASQHLDVWGSDMVARKDQSDLVDRRLLWIQASLDGAVQKRIVDFATAFSANLHGEECQLWIKKSTGSIVVKRIDVEKHAAEDLGKIIRGRFYPVGTYHF